MKTVVSVNEISEFDIKPQASLQEWKQKVLEETAAIDKTQWIETACPVCAQDQPLPAFNRSGFVYAECAHCKTLYAQTRPSDQALTNWYTNSESVAFWQGTLLRQTEVSRYEKIIEPRAYWILDGISEYMPHGSRNALRYTDISFFGRALVKKIAVEAPQLQLVSAGITDGKEPYASGNINIRTLASIAEYNTLERTDILVAIDVLERIRSIHDFVTALEEKINVGGLVFATCPVSSGFEIQCLWEHSPSIIPPDKLNLPSVQGLLELFSASGKWKVLELSTPGMFDVRLVKQAMNASPDHNWPRSLRALMDTMDNQGMQLFTEYLQSQRLSSFARIVLRKEKD
jgi:hypothetical protein